MAFSVTGQYGPEALLDSAGNALSGASVSVPDGYTASLDPLGNLTVTGPPSGSVPVTVSFDDAVLTTLSVTVAPAVSELATVRDLAVAAETPEGAQAKATAARVGLAALTASQTFTGTQTSTPAASSGIPLVLRGVASQTGDLTQWRDSAGRVRAFIGPDGQGRVNGLGIGSAATDYAGLPTAARLNVVTATTNEVGQVIRGIASQSADLQQWQNSAGTVLASVGANGGLTFPNGSFIDNFGNYTTPNGRLVAGTNGSGTNSPLTAFSSGAGNVVALLRGAASQTANLTEWQDSAGTAVAIIRSDGFPRVKGVLDLEGSGAVLTTNPASTNNGAFVFTQRNAGNVNVKFRAGDADMTQWLNQSGVVRARFDTSAQMRLHEQLAVGPDPVAGGVATTLLVQSFTAGTSGQVIRGIASQTADLQQWQNSAGTVLANVSAAGDLRSATGYFDTFGVGGGNRFGGATSTVVTQNANQGGLFIRGSASQAVDLQQWQNSAGTVVTLVRPDGQLASASGLSLENALRDDVVATLVSKRAGRQVLVVRGETSQSANLQEWQNSSGTTLANISSVGGLRLTAGGPGLDFFGGTNTQEIGTSANAMLRLQTFSTGNVSIGAGSGAGLFVSGDTGLNHLVANAPSATRQAIIARGAASQSADLQQWQNSAGTVLASVEASGSVKGKYLSNNATHAPGDVVSAIRGVATQTADLTQWQNAAGTTIAAITAGGFLNINTAQNIGLRQLEVGAPDSAGTGFRTVRVAN